jgi:hypothetical protein
MNEQLLMMVVFGSILVGFGVFASYMAGRQEDRERREEKSGQLS